jgi:hypothetical protein
MFDVLKHKMLWLVLLIGFAASVASVFFAPFGDSVRAVLAVPAVAAVLGAMFQVFREDIANERAREVQEARNRFEIGITSHMADVAFDKHVLFCEEYALELHDALKTLFRRGPCAEALQHVYNLSEIRRKWAIWVPSELSRRLDEFQGALAEIGANAQLLEVAPGDAHSIRVMYERFAQVYGLSRWNGREVPTDLALTTAIENLRGVLGIRELTQIRDGYISRAVQLSATSDRSGDVRVVR